VDGGASAQGSNAINNLGGSYGQVAAGVVRGTTGQDGVFRNIE
jgi:hypothetical protein